MAVKWIENFSGALGALSDPENLQAKALLSFWLKNNAAVAPQLTGLNYPSQAEDYAPEWTSRDGWVLSAFTTWWDATKGQTLDIGTIDLSRGVYPWVDLSSAHAAALNSWAKENGFLPANWQGPTPVEQPSLSIPGLPPGLPAIPGLPGIPAIPPSGWSGTSWPPTPPAWWPPSLGGIFPPIGNWGQGALQKPPGWDLTGLPWPPPTPGISPNFPGTWGKLPTGQPYPFPIPPKAFVQGAPPPEPATPTCPTGQVWDGTQCQPLPPPPPPKTGTTTTTSGMGAGTIAALVIAGVVVAIVVISNMGATPVGD
jgi:hypothetical protein